MKTNILKMVALMMSILLVITAGGCSQKKQLKINGYTVDELRDMHEVMFEAVGVNYGLKDFSSDYWSNDNFVVYYDGTIEGSTDFYLTGRVGEFSDELSDEDYIYLIEFLSGDFSDGDCDIDVQACDGVSWHFDFFDTQGTILHAFRGYTYGIEDLENLQSMLFSYQPDYERPPLYPDQ